MRDSGKVIEKLAIAIAIPIGTYHSFDESYQRPPQALFGIGHEAQDQLLGK